MMSTVGHEGTGSAREVVGFNVSQITGEMYFADMRRLLETARLQAAEAERLEENGDARSANELFRRAQLMATHAGHNELAAYYNRRAAATGVVESPFLSPFR